MNYIKLLKAIGIFIGCIVFIGVLVGLLELIIKYPDVTIIILIIMLIISFIWYIYEELDD